jgi:rod shape-determining protein MreD
MINNIVRSIVYFLIFMTLQLLVLNNISFFRVATPFLYLYIILKQPTDLSRNQIVIISFLAGVIMDLFSNTPGMHAAVCTFVGVIREPLFHFFIGKEISEGSIPSYRVCGFGGFFRYTLSFVVIHHTALFILESLILFDPLFLLIRIVSSVILTTALILTVEALNFESSRSGE